MPPAARLGDETTHGTPLFPGIGSVNVIIGGQPAWRAEIDQHACPAVSITGADGVGSVLMGSPTVMINGMMACRMGDIVVEKPGLALGPANPIMMGCPTVIIGDGAAGGGGGMSSASGSGSPNSGSGSAEASTQMGTSGSSSGTSPTAAAAVGPGASFGSAGGGGNSDAADDPPGASCSINAAKSGSPFIKPSS
jgi:uncharacterized Zn-binding protein involved in type VI secretion